MINKEKELLKSRGWGGKNGDGFIRHIPPSKTLTKSKANKERLYE